MRLRASIAAVALFAAALLGGEQLWLGAKAELAARLIDGAFLRHLDDGGHHPPWPWADTAPIAELTVPSLGVRRVVLSGATGATLAFGPGHVDGTALPGRHGNAAIAGHRDSWFRFLRDLEEGTSVELRTLGGRSLWTVTATRVVDRRDISSLAPTVDDRLTLITCYPFDAIVPGPLRYVVSLSPAPGSSAAGSSKIERGSDS